MADTHTDPTAVPFFATAQAAVDGIALADGGRIVYANPALERMLSYAPGELAGRPLGVLMPPELGDAREPRTAELTVQRKDGRSVTIELSVSRGEWDGRWFLTAIARDIGHRKAAQAALARSEALLEQAVQLAGVGTWEWDIKADVVSWSDQLYRIFRVDPDSFDASYAAYLDHVHPDDRERVDGIVRDALTTCEPFAFEHRTAHPDGDVRTLSCRGETVAGKDGRPLRMLGIAQDITDRKRLEDELRRLADHDSLTGLMNRRRFEEELSRYAAYARRYGRGGAVLLLDLDNLKDINDTIGHGAGDAVISGVAHAISARLRASDLVARLGGDEFVVLLPETDPAQARTVADTLRSAVAATRTAFAGHDLRTTASIGVAHFGGSAADPAQLLARSDIAMYAAKAGGRNRVAVHEAAPVPSS